MGENHLRQAFDILDIDKDGSISIEELKQCFSYGNLGAGLNGQQTGERVDESLWDELLADIDKNGDGKIDFDEFTDHMMGLIGKGCYDRRWRISARKQTDGSLEVEVSPAPQLRESEISCGTDIVRTGNLS